MGTMPISLLEFYTALFQDAVFMQKQDGSSKYDLDNGQFKRRNIDDVVKTIAEMADWLYDKMVVKDLLFGKCKPHIDYVGLRAVISRYSRDIYGLRRIKAKLENLEEAVGKFAGNTVKFKEDIERIILESADFGFLIPSSNPYIHREAAVLIYWFSVLKPFHLEYKPNVENPFPDEYYRIYFNEYFSYSLINLALRAQSVELSIHKNERYFKVEFLGQLHYRNLNRSSLEIFLSNWVKNIKNTTEKGA
jgi:hypothetical protein